MKRITAAFVLRTLDRLELIADRYWLNKEFAAFLARNGVTKNTTGSLGTFLEDIASLMPQDPLPVCAECGREWDTCRTDRRFCSARCRQRAYRKRVTDIPAINQQAVTDRGFRDGSAAHRLDRRNGETRSREAGRQ